MQVVVVGISHKTASLELRERLALDVEAALRLSRELLDEGAACEVVALSTCNRTELYLYGRDSLAARQSSLVHLARHAGVAPSELEPSLYCLSGDGAIAHLFRVTAGLDSLVVGEAQIVAQLKAAYQQACSGGCTATVFNHLFRHALEVGKRVRTETTIGERPVSVSSAAVELARRVFGRFRDHTVLIIGAGETSELTATHLKAHGIEKILLTNRTLATSQELARRIGGRAVGFEDLEDHLAAADIVISSTSAPHCVVTRKVVERACRRRRQRPMFLIDIAVPRDLDPEIARVRNAYLYDIDDLLEVVEHNRHEREGEAEHAESIIKQELASVNEWLRSLQVVPTIAMLREAVEEIRKGELERLGNRLRGLTDEQRAQVDMLTTSIINKILHVPTVKMKEVAGQDQCYLYVDALRTLFDLGDDGASPARAGDANGAGGLGVAGDPGDTCSSRDMGSSRDTGGRPAALPAPPADEDSCADVVQLRGTGTDDA